MKSKKSVMQALSALQKKVYEDLAKYEEENSPFIMGLAGTEATEDSVGKLHTFIKYISVAISAFPAEGYPDIQIPKFHFDCKAYGTVLDEIELSVRSWDRTENSIRAKEVIKVDDSFIENVTEFLWGMGVQMLYIQVAEENIEALNAHLTELYDANDVEKRVVFEVNTKKEARVLAINDDVLTLRAYVEEALSISDLPMMVRDNGEAPAEDSEDDTPAFNEIISDKADAQFVETMKTCSTTQEILKKKIPLLETLSGLKTLKSAHKLIREGYSRTADKVKVGCEGYVIIEEKDKKYFSILRKEEDGYTVVLRPFDTSTLAVSKIDVVKRMA